MTQEQLYITELEQRIIRGESLSFEEAVKLLQLNNKNLLYDCANRIRKHFWKNKFDLCSIVNARSGNCSENCKWCAQSKHHSTKIDVYDMVKTQTVLQQAIDADKAGVKKFSLISSGRSVPMDTIDKFCSIYNKVREVSQIELCASMGLLSREKLQKLYDVGVRNYHCNIETAPSHFPTLCTTHTIEEKEATIREARAVGMKICSGGIIGMGETAEQRVEMAIKLQQMSVESIPLNLLNPIEGTALQGQELLTDEAILTTIAIFRLTNPKAWIRFAGGRILYLHIQEKALKSGINAALVGDLLTTVGVEMKSDIKFIQSQGFDINS